MRHSDPIYPELAINLSPGYQYLNGKQALAYVRYRGGPTADIGRTENQQKFIKALAKEMLQTKTIVKLPQLIPQINKNVRTNLPLEDMIYLANMVPKLDLDNINAQTLPGYFLHDYVTGASYWEADKQIASTILDSMLKGQTFKVVGEAPASAQPPAVRNPVSAVVATQQEMDANKIKEAAEGAAEGDKETETIKDPATETDDETNQEKDKQDDTVKPPPVEEPKEDQASKDKEPIDTTPKPVQPNPPLDNIKP
jgi:polyisoprenyl-teichoic acid--peptidoglycan teichoic acid transferase